MVRKPPDGSAQGSRLQLHLIKQNNENCNLSSKVQVKRESRGLNARKRIPTGSVSRRMSERAREMPLILDDESVQTFVAAGQISPLLGLTWPGLAWPGGRHAPAVPWQASRWTVVRAHSLLRARLESQRNRPRATQFSRSSNFLSVCSGSEEGNGCLVS